MCKKLLFLISLILLLAVAGNAIAQIDPATNDTGKVPVARDPSPANGALIVNTPVDLFWTPGDFAVSQNLYFGDNLDDVNAGAESTFLALGQSAAGVAVPITLDNLVAGTTYYWRIDAVNDANPDSPWKGRIWSFTLAPQTASAASPTDGAMFVNPSTILSWVPGLNVESHTVYIGDSFDNVNNAANGLPQIETTYDAGLLAKGTVYYWRVDEFDGRYTYKGDIWSFETQPEIAITDPNLVGLWKLDGDYFDLGYVVDHSGYDHHGTPRGDPLLIEGYFGNALEFDGVDDYVNIDGYKGINAINGVQQPFSITNWFRIAPGASDGNVEMVTWGTNAGQQQLTWSIHQGRLCTEHASGNLRGDTYVDDDEWHHGALVVTEGANLRVPATRLYVDGFEDTTFSGSDNTYNLTTGADVRIGMSGPQNGRYFPCSIDDVHIFDKVITDIDVKIISGFLQSSNPDPADGGKIVDTSAILTWSPGPLAAEFDVYFGTNSEPGVNEFVGRVSEASHIATNLAKGQTYYWRVDDVEADGTTIHTGNVWSLWTPPKSAYNPNPTDGQEITDTDTDLNWDANWSPVMYVVHFGMDIDQVTNIPVGVGPPWLQIGSDPGPLEPGMTYYWRIDVLYDTWVIGEVWSFTVADFIVIDDFESYNDLDPNDPQSNRIFNAWLDGFDDPTNGSLVGYDNAPFAEQIIVHGGSQSMPLYYDNAVGKSEATSILTDTRDWTQEDIGVLSLWFQGDAANAAEPMYVSLSNTNGPTTEVYHDDPNATQVTTWTEWRINLQVFANQGVDLTNVNSITLGFGNRDNPVAGGAGMMYFDDIRLYRQF